jgi:Ca2+-binding RTX toxin-like protein
MGSLGADDIPITLREGRVEVSRFGGFLALVIGTTERLKVKGVGGDDVITAAPGLDGVIKLRLNGGAGNDQIAGGDGDDGLLGQRGRDQLRGDIGDDWLAGGEARDVLVGGIGADAMRGGRHADTFVFEAVSDSPDGEGRDRISDFQAGRDKIDLGGIDADSGQSGNQAFSFVGREPFSGAAGELRFARGLLQGDVDGDARADLEVRIDNIARLPPGDLIV